MGLGVGEVGYLITGVKDVRQSKVGDTVTSQRHGATEPLAGYREPRPMVYSGLYPVDGSEYPDLREALDKLQLNDAALTYEPETSAALGLRLPLRLPRPAAPGDHPRPAGARGRARPRSPPRRTSSTAWSLDDGKELTVTNPSDWPTGKVAQIFEPVVKVTILAPSEFIGAIMELCQSRRGQLGGMDYLSETRVELRYTMPLAEIIFDFFDALKSRTRGYASLDYEEAGEQESDLVKVDILLQGEPVDAFSAIRHKDAAFSYGTTMATKLRELIPRQQFEVPIQAAIGVADHRAGEHPRDPQGRARQVLRRRHHPQAQAAGEAEGGQEADEDHRAGRGPAGGLRRGAVHRLVGREEEVGNRDGPSSVCTARRRRRDHECHDDVIPHGRPFTVDDLEGFPDDGNRYELIDGMLLVSPAPDWAHQEMGGRCRAVAAACPIDLRVMIAPFAVQPRSTRACSPTFW